MENCTNPSYFEVEACTGGCCIKKYTGPKEGSVVIPSRLDGKEVTAIGDEVFAECGDLTGITIPGSVTEIGSKAFAFCTGLTEITIPGSVVKIDMGAFAFCTGLTSVKIGRAHV